MIKPALLLSGCLFLLFSLSPCEGQPHVKVSAWAGENVVLPCEIPPTEDISVEWSKKGLKPDVVYLYRDGCETHEMKNPAHVFRTHLFMTEMKNGNISLMISNVQPSDTGTYRCLIVSTQQIIKTVHLTVGEVSQSDISITSESGSDGETLQCEVCWLPKPEVSWLDDQGKVIEGRGSTLRNPDVNQCYTVTSTVKVQSSDSSRKFTVRIRQPQINNIRKINFHLPAKSTAPCTGYLAGIIVSSLLSLAIGVGVGIFVTKKMTKEAEWSQTPTPATSRRSSSDSAASTEDKLLPNIQPAEPLSQQCVESNNQMQNQQLNMQQSVVIMAPNSVPHISVNGNTSSSPQSPTDRNPHTGMFTSDSDAKPSLSPHRNCPSFSKYSQSEGPKHGDPVQDSGPPPCSPSRGNSPGHIGSPKRSTPDLSKAAAKSTTSLFNKPLAQKSSFPVRSNSCSLPVCGPYTSMHGKKSPSFRADQNRYSALAK
ncbi:butyrophilin subfamily 3 member A3-like [Myripristis murdjan]|uniref:butyrophilin subfamily 3 member A3-like n=1 Tax=Myripristis murdjan TaxID=586833 RepID=UPI0011760465|nr:butyrophilin subfamily 3 member A3-like [Myripristis murdjan]